MTLQLFVTLPLAISSVAAAFASVCADAQPPVAGDTSHGPRRSTAAEPARFVPGAVAAEAGAPAATGSGWAGYDGATRTPLVGATADVRLGTRIVVGAGATYASPDRNVDAELRPSVFARYQILDQAQAGVDLGAAFAYRQDRFVSEEGLLQATLSLGVRHDAGAALVSLGYGQDGEGDDHLGDARLVAFHPVSDTFHVGFDGHVQWLFDSTDPDRAQHGTPSLELTVAPAIGYRVGPAMLLLEVGWSGVEYARFRSGMLAVGGVGTAF